MNIYYQTTPQKQNIGTLTINCINEFSNTLFKLCKNLTFKDINLKNLKIAIDAKHGTSGIFWEEIYKKFNNKLSILNKELYLILEIKKQIQLKHKN